MDFLGRTSGATRRISARRAFPRLIVGEAGRRLNDHTLLKKASEADLFLRHSWRSRRLGLRDEGAHEAPEWRQIRSRPGREFCMEYPSSFVSSPRNRTPPSPESCVARAIGCGALRPARRTACVIAGLRVKTAIDACLLELST